MAPDVTKNNIDVPTAAADAPKEKFTPEKLNALKDAIGANQFQNVVDTLIGSAEKTGEIPTSAQIDAYVMSLLPAERDALTNYLTTNTDTPEEAALHKKLTDSPTENIAVPAQQEELTGPAKKIMDLVDQQIEKLGIADKISDLSKKFGFGGEVGPKQIEFVKNVFIEMMMKFCEKIAFAGACLMPAMQIKNFMETTLQLRLIQIKQENANDYGVSLAKLKETYAKAYIDAANLARKNQVKFVPPTLDEVMAPKPVTPSTQPEVLQPLSVGKKVEGTQNVTLMDKTMFEITRNNEKTVVKAAGNTAELTVKDVKVLDVMTLDATDQKNAVVTLKLVDNRTIAVDAEKLRDAVQKKEPSFKTPEGITIELLAQAA